MIVVSGLSGAGKTVALHTLEDLGYYCIDNLPVALLPAMVEERKHMEQPIAVGVDVRSHNRSDEGLPNAIERLKQENENIQILFLTANTEILIKRFSESRRKHPLSDEGQPLAEAINAEQQFLSPLVANADLKIDTSQTNIYQFKGRIRDWLLINKEEQTLLTLESFGFKNGVPVDADLMFDVRFLPNPHWEGELRPFTGQDKVVQDYLGQYDECERFIADTSLYLSRWLPTYLQSNSTYLTVAIGCTGGKHRSVYITEQIADRLKLQFGSIHLRHRDMPGGFNFEALNCSSIIN